MSIKNFAAAARQTIHDARHPLLAVAISVGLPFAYAVTAAVTADHRPNNSQQHSGRQTVGNPVSKTSSQRHLIP
jgi:hypothetical protein